MNHTIKKIEDAIDVIENDYGQYRRMYTKDVLVVLKYLLSIAEMENKIKAEQHAP